MSIPVTKADLEGQAISRLARAVMKFWPSERKPKLAEAQQFVATALGYDNLHDLQQTAIDFYSDSCLDMPAIRAQVSNNLKSAGFNAELASIDFAANWVLNVLECTSSSHDFTPTENQEILLKAVSMAYRFVWNNPGYLHDQTGEAAAPQQAVMDCFERKIASVSEHHLGQTPQDLAGLDVHELKDVIQYSFVPLHVDMVEWSLRAVSKDNFIDDVKERFGDDFENAILQCYTEEFIEHASSKLLQITEREKYQRPLRELFTKSPIQDGFLSYLDDWPNIGSKKKGRTLKSEFGPVEVSFNTDWDDGDSALKTAYWSAVLRDSGGVKLSHCCGMIYVNKGYYLKPYDLIDSADRWNNAAVDVIHQFIELIKEDADDDDEDDEGLFMDALNSWFSDSALVSVHTWERSSDSPKGSGMACLFKALQAIKMRVKLDVNVVVDFNSPRNVDLPESMIPESLMIERVIKSERLFRSIWASAVEQGLDKKGVVMNVARVSPSEARSNYGVLGLVAQYMMG